MKMNKNYTKMKKPNAAGATPKLPKPTGSGKAKTPAKGINATRKRS